MEAEPSIFSRSPFSVRRDFELSRVRSRPNFEDHSDHDGLLLSSYAGSWGPEDTSDKPDLALLKTAPRVLGLLREIVDVHRQAQLCLRGDCAATPGAVLTGVPFIMLSLASSKYSALNPVSPSSACIASVEIRKLSAGSVAHGSGK